MKTTFIKTIGAWQDVVDACNETVGKETGCKEPPDLWKRRLLLCEHSPIRLISVIVKWQDIPYWVSTHFVRHWLGIIHFVKTQRTNRTGIPRDKLPQDSPVNHRF